MKAIKFLLFTFTLGLVLTGCGKDDNTTKQKEYISGDWNGVAFSYDNPTKISVFGLTSYTFVHEDSEFQFQLTSTDTGVYGLSGNNTFDISYDFYSMTEGVFEITEKNTDDGYIEGTFEFELENSLQGPEDVSCTNGEFRLDL